MGLGDCHTPTVCPLSQWHQRGWSLDHPGWSPACLLPSQDPFGEKRGHFDYQSLLVRLGLIRQKVLERLHSEAAEMDSDSSSSGTEADLHGGLRL